MVIIQISKPNIRVPDKQTAIRNQGRKIRTPATKIQIRNNRRMDMAKALISSLPMATPNSRIRPIQQPVTANSCIRSNRKMGTRNSRISNIRQLGMVSSSPPMGRTNSSLINSNRPMGKTNNHFINSNLQMATPSSPIRHSRPDPPLHRRRRHACVEGIKAATQFINLRMYRPSRKPSP